MKTRFDKIGYPLYCDAGPDEGSMRMDMQVRLYLSAEEYARYEGAESLVARTEQARRGDRRLQVPWAAAAARSDASQIARRRAAAESREAYQRWQRADIKVHERKGTRS